MAEDKRLVRVSVWLPKGDVECIKFAANAKGVPMGHLLRRAVAAWVSTFREDTANADKR